MHRPIMFAVVLISVMYLSPSSAFAYNTDTHAYLTSEILSLYNKSFTGLSIPDTWKPYLLDGSRREDDQFRALNHFYDPVYNRGFNNALLGSWNKSPDWAVSETLQNQSRYKTAAAAASMLTAAEQDSLGLVSSETDFAWSRGIRAYARGDGAKAAFILGHILHLIEDLGVPDHTRNETHPGTSPYENWTGRFSLQSPDTALTTKLNVANPVSLASLEDYFNELATYSNNNFYSENTIGIDQYSSPVVDFVSKDGKYMYGFKFEDGQYYHLAVYKRFTGSVLLASKMDIGIKAVDEDMVVKDYWSHLAPKVIEYGAGVVRLFIEEGEKAKKDVNFVKDDPKSFLGEAADTIGKLVSAGINSVKDIISGSKNSAEMPPIIDSSPDSVTPKVNSPSTVEKFPAEEAGSESANNLSPNLLVPSEAAVAENTEFSPPVAPAMPQTQDMHPEGGETQTSPPIAIFNPGNMAPVSVVLPPVQVTLPSNNPTPDAATASVVATSTEVVTVSASSTEAIATTTLPVATTTVPESAATSTLPEHFISAFNATTTSSSTLRFEWTLAEGITATSSLTEMTGSSTLPFYTGTSTAFDYIIAPGPENRNFILTAEYNGITEIASTTVILAMATSTPKSPPEPVNPPPGTVINLGWSADPATRTVKFTAELWSVNPQNSSRLELKFRRMDTPLDGPADLVGSYVKNGESANIVIPVVKDGQYHWIARVADSDGGMSLWQAEAGGEIIIPRPPVLASGYWGPSNFPNGYCHFGKTELIPSQDINVSSVEFWASCVNGDCSAPNTFQIYDATGTALLAESDGSAMRFGYPDFNWIWENFTGSNHITLTAGETYRVTPHSYHGTCMVNPASPDIGTFSIR